MKSKRRLLFLGVALSLGVAVALGVVLFMGRGEEPAQTAQSSTVTAAASASVASSQTTDPLAVDPAKQEPLLDKFRSKDPFIPLGVAGSSSTSSTSSTSQVSLSAKVTMNGQSYTVSKGDTLPSSNSVFSVASISSSSVTFALISGSFENGDSSISVSAGESVKVVKEGGSSYTLKVVSIGGTSTSSAAASGHSITVLSISQSNGTPVVTLEIDGKTYADKKTGDSFTTGWGEVEVTAIDDAGQTVTIMHGDQTITLHAGQVVVK